jgi:hypothetical protein
MRDAEIGPISPENAQAPGAKNLQRTSFPPGFNRSLLHGSLLRFLTISRVRLDAVESWPQKGSSIWVRSSPNLENLLRPFEEPVSAPEAVMRRGVPV